MNHRQSNYKSTQTSEASTISGRELAGLMQAVLAKGKPFRFQATGWSMAPFIRHGDRLTIVSMGRSPSLGDVVAFKDPTRHRVIVHRVIGNPSGRRVLVQGDNLTQPDGFVQRRSIIGRVAVIERNGGRIRLGIGVEKVLIALLARSGLLGGFLLPAIRRFRNTSMGAQRRD